MTWFTFYFLKDWILIFVCFKWRKCFFMRMGVQNTISPEFFSASDKPSTRTSLCTDHHHNFHSIIPLPEHGPHPNHTSKRQSKEFSCTRSVASEFHRMWWPVSSPTGRSRAQEYQAIDGVVRNVSHIACVTLQFRNSSISDTNRGSCIFVGRIYSRGVN